jgi:hypothetical protein
MYKTHRQIDELRRRSGGLGGEDIALAQNRHVLAVDEKASALVRVVITQLPTMMRSCGLSSTLRAMPVLHQGFCNERLARAIHGRLPVGIWHASHCNMFVAC